MTFNPSRDPPLRSRNKSSTRPCSRTRPGITRRKLSAGAAGRPRTSGASGTGPAGHELGLVANNSGQLTGYQSMMRQDGIVEAETRTASACNCFAKIRNPCYLCPVAGSNPRLGRHPAAKRKESEFSYFFTSQPVEKSRIGRIKPRISKQFCLDWLGSIRPPSRNRGHRVGSVPSNRVTLYSNGSADFSFIATPPGADILTWSAVAAAPVPSTWAMLLTGFARLGLLGYRNARSRGRFAPPDYPSSRDGSKMLRPTSRMSLSPHSAMVMSSSLRMMSRHAATPASPIAPRP